MPLPVLCYLVMKTILSNCHADMRASYGHIFPHVPPLIWISSQVHETNLIHKLSKFFLNILIHTSRTLPFLFTCFLFCRCDDCIQQFHFLSGWTIQFFNMTVNHVGVDTRNSPGQFTLAFFRFRIMDNHMDWSTFSADTTHLPWYFSL